jgi:hypothetical protein
MALNAVYTQNAGNVGGASGNGDFDSPADVPAGTIAFFPADGGSSISINDTTDNKFEDQGEIQIVLGTPDGPRITNIIDAGDVTVSSLAHAAPAKQVTNVTPETVSEDQYITLKTTNLERGYEPYKRRSFTVEAEASDTVGDIVDKLVTAINNREDGLAGYEGSTVTAANNADVLQLTADEFGEIFDVGVDFEATVNAATAPTEGTGTGEQVRSMEERVTAFYGRYNEEDPILGSLDDVDIYAVESNNYDLITIRQETDYDRAINKSARFQDVVLALEEGLDKTHVNSFFANQGVSL